MAKFQTSTMDVMRKELPNFTALSSISTTAKMIELIKDLIRIDSVSGNEAKLVSFFSKWLTEKLPVKHEVRDRNIIIDIKGNEYKEGTGTTLLLCSHIDTVPATSGWTKDPFGALQEGEKIYGLGANDALASVVSMTYGALAACKDIKKGRLLLAFVCEEEKGLGGFATIEPTLPRYTYAIFGEPTTLRIGNDMRGAMKIRLFSRGRSCHASRPHEGENAIFKLAKDLETVRTLPLKDNSSWGQATVEPTIVKGGLAENQIPDVVETLLDIRTTPEKNNDYILSLLKDRGLDFEIVRNLRRPMHCPSDSPLVKSVLAAVPNAQLYPFGGSCDMAFSKSTSIVFGPGESVRSHSADEYITESELKAGTDAYASIIRTILG